MKLLILRRFTDLMNDPDAKKAWLDLIELRQRIYSQQFGHALILDRYDLIADHILLYSSRENVLMGYVRSITSQTCRERNQPLPLQAVVDAFRADYEVSFREFLKKAPIAVNMSYLCLDPAYRGELQGIKIIDLLTWIALRATGHDYTMLGYCATPNSKYKLTAWLDQLGEKTENLPRFNHEVIPEPHELILIPAIRASYWQEKTVHFQAFFDEMRWLGSPAGVPREAAA